MALTVIHKDMGHQPTIRAQAGSKTRVPEADTEISQARDRGLCLLFKSWVPMGVKCVLKI